MGKIVGIDLGTTTSIISYLKNGKPEIIPNLEGERLTDSAVTQDKYGNIIVGSIAKRSLGSIREIKRKMGSSERTSMGDLFLLPEEVSAEILKKLKSDAEEFLGEEITEAVITVPAMFNSIQKAATIKAGELAGLKVERIISEPTAAAMAYGLENLNKTSKILVYDFGGGTFDASILDLDEGILDVMATAGNNQLGGKDIDQALMEHIIDESGKKGHNEAIKAKFIQNVEKAKKDLSSSYGIDFIFPELEIDLEITRNEFDEIIEGVVDETFDCIDSVLKDSGIEEDEIDVVLPIGGTSRIPYIKNRLKKRFGNKVKNFSDPQEVVALGAAVQAGIKSYELPSEYSLIVTDICNYSLGIEVIGEKYSVIIPKHTKRPCSKSQIYYTVQDNQEVVRISIFQGENPMVTENIRLKEFSLEGIPKKKAGEEEIRVTFMYDINDILKVEAEILSTGKIVKTSVQMSKDEFGEEIIVEGKKSLEKEYKESPYYSQYKSILDLAEQKLEKVEGNKKEKIEIFIKEIKKSLIEENIKKLEQLDDELTDFLFEM